MDGIDNGTDATRACRCEIRHLSMTWRVRLVHDDAKPAMVGYVGEMEIGLQHQVTIGSDLNEVLCSPCNRLGYIHRPSRPLVPPSSLPFSDSLATDCHNEAVDRAKRQRYLSLPGRR